MNEPSLPPNNDSLSEPAPAAANPALIPEKPGKSQESERPPADDRQMADAILGNLKREMNRLQREIRQAIQAQLGQMAGRSLGSIEANRDLAKSIQEMLDAHGLRVRCSQCGHPAILRVSPRSGAAAGVFVFDHTIEGRRTFHGGRISLPEIRLVAKPTRKPRTTQPGKSNDSDNNRAAG